jgi:hypothetical protein
MRSKLRFRAVCNALAALFLALALVRLALAGATLFDPLLGSVDLQCEPACSLSPDPVRLLPGEEARIEAWRTGGFGGRLIEHLADPRVAALLFVAEAARAIPLSALLFALALALRALASEGIGARSVRWLRRSALASLFWIASASVAASFAAMAFAPLLGRGSFVIALQLPPSHVVISAALWIALRVLQEALDLRTETEAYV